MDCGRCTEELNADGDYAYCTKCKTGYHFICTTVTEASWRSMGPERKNQWRCTSCREKGDKTKTPVGRTKSNEEQNDPDEKMRNLLNEILTKKFKEFEDKIMKKMQDKNMEFEKCLEFTTGRLEDIAKQLAETEKKVILVEKKQEKCEAEYKEMKTKLRNYEIMLNEMAQKENLNKLEIVGFPNEDFNVTQVAKVFLDKTQIDLAQGN
ncbi:hypothetical protein M8J75_001322 [Diaphorina citri]|nr:hypothetical protein M8J75_001322 [Diaphorina citri]